MWKKYSYLGSFGSTGAFTCQYARSFSPSFLVSPPFSGRSFVSSCISAPCVWGKAAALRLCIRYLSFKGAAFFPLPLFPTFLFFLSHPHAQFPVSRARAVQSQRKRTSDRIALGSIFPCIFLSPSPFPLLPKDNTRRTRSFLLPLVSLFTC